MSITAETRREAYINRPVTRQSVILDVLTIKGEMTAREIAYDLGYSDLNAVKPRLTELKNAGQIEVVGKAKDMLTGRSTAIYARV